MFLAVGLTAAAQDNLVKNGDFENWDGGAPAQWQKSAKGSPSNATVKEAAEGRSGKALEVEHKGKGKNAQNSRYHCDALQLRPAITPFRSMPKRQVREWSAEVGTPPEQPA